MTTQPSALELRRTIERHILGLYEADGTTLRARSTWPGTYTLTNGTQIPAVYVVGESMVPSNWAITGIETTLDDVPESGGPLTASGLVTIETWPVRFTNYGTREGTRMPLSMLDIRRRLARAFPGDQATYMPRTEATFEALTARLRVAVLNTPIP